MAIAIYPGNQDTLIQKTKNGGVPSALGGKFFIQAAASTALHTSTAETTILGAGVSGVLLPSDGEVSYSYNGLTMPANFLNVGSILKFRLVGVVGNTGTPNLTIRALLTDSAGNVTVLSTTGATAMATITGSMQFEYEVEAVVRSVGATGSLIASAHFDYVTATATAPLRLIAAPAAATVDTTESFTIDIKATWSASSASNTITTQYAIGELVF